MVTDSCQTGYAHLYFLPRGPTGLHLVDLMNPGKKYFEQIIDSYAYAGGGSVYCSLEYFDAVNVFVDKVMDNDTMIGGFS